MLVLFVLRQSVAILENGEIVEMRARTFKAVRQWCLAYQEQWQVYNNLCLNDELSADYRKAAAAGGEAIADYRDYPVQAAPGEKPETLPGSGGRAEILSVEDPNTRTRAAKYIYGAVCTGVLNYACRKILETSVVKPDTDTVAVPTNAEVDELLAKFDQQTPQIASAQAAVAEQLKEAAAAPTGEQQTPGPAAGGPEEPPVSATTAPGEPEGPANRAGELQEGAGKTPSLREQKSGAPVEGEEGPQAFGDEETYPDIFPGDLEEGSTGGVQPASDDRLAAVPSSEASKEEAAANVSPAASPPAVAAASPAANQGNAAAAAPPPSSEGQATGGSAAAP